MKPHLPSPTIPKTRLQMADEYNLQWQTFKRKVARAGIKLTPGLVMPGDQLRIYEALGPPVFVWIDDHTRIPFLEP